MNRPCARLAFVSALLLVAALAPRGAAASTVLTGGNLVNQTWTPAGSPYVIEGDVTIPKGSTLTIQAGTDVQFTSGDMQVAGLDPARTELTVDGALIIAGTTTSPVTFEMQQGQTGTWYGIVVSTGATAAIVTGASFAGYSTYAISSSMTGAILSVTRTAVRGNGNGGILVSAGVATLDSLTIMPATGAATLSTGLELDGHATADDIDVTNVLIVDATYGVDVGGSVTVKMSNLTIDHPAFGIYVNGTTASVTVGNTIISNAIDDGMIAAASGTTTVSFSDIWNDGTATSQVTTGTGMIAANPQYVATGSEYYRLQPSSVCIDSGGSAGAPDHDLDGVARPLDGDGINGAAYDMGAYEFNSGGSIGGAGGSSASGTGGAGGTPAAGGASGTGGGAAGATGGGGGAAGVGGVGSGGAPGGAGARGPGGSAGATGSAGAGATGSGGATGAGGGGGATGAAGAAGTGGALAGTGGAAGSVGTGGTASGGSGGGCGCQTGGPGASAWGLLLVGGLILRRRRRSSCA